MALSAGFKVYEIIFAITDLRAINLGLILRAAFKVINWDYNKLITLGIITKNANIMDYCFFMYLSGYLRL